MSLRPPLHLPRRSAAALAAVVVGAAVLTGCLSAPADTSKVAQIDSANVDGWHYDYFEDRAYPCSVSGYQTFAIGRKIGSSETSRRPLWVKLRGGGSGWFDDAGNAVPGEDNMVELTLDEMLVYDTPGLMAQVKEAPEGFRTLIVSMCSQDLYSGNGNVDPHNPNRTSDGRPRPTTGLPATKAAVQFTRDRFPTSAYFLHGTSAGGAGTFSVAWALQQQGIAPAGLVSDSGVIDRDHSADIPDSCTVDDESPRANDNRVRLAARLDPELADARNTPDQLVARGQLTVPIAHVWNHGDPKSCGGTPMTCWVPGGSAVTLGVTDCRHEDLRRAIAAQGPHSRSLNLGVCVAGPPPAGPCELHVVTTRPGAVNTDPTAPADYQTAILHWVRVRLADPR